MEDDIDIEEHDVMDNPKIKSIFPDLSCVKIEEPDVEELERQDVHDEAKYYPPQEMLYQIEYSFGTIPENVTEEKQESSEYDDVDDDGYFHNNEIILGSKPPIDESVLYEEALHSHPIVFLENWENRLLTSPCFCGTCQILFPTVNALDAHKMISHSYLIALDTPRENTARKSTVTSKYCNHCSKTFPDDTSLIKHLYELLPLNDFDNVKEEKISVPVSKKEPQYMCQKCKNTFVTYNAGFKHKRNKHPTLRHIKNLVIRIETNKVNDNEVELKPKKVKIEPKEVKIEPKKVKIEPKIVKIEPKKVKVEPKETKVQLKDRETTVKLKRKSSRGGKFFETSSLVPTKTLFQCNVCQVGFLSCYPVVQHTNFCDKVMKSEKCDICKRKIRMKDVKIHKLQHNYTDKLKIYTVNKNIYERVMCKCPKCMGCFEEIGFWAHFPKCNKTEKRTTYCSVCDVHIATVCYGRHRLKHSSKKLTKKDFIIVEFHDENAVTETDNRIITENQINLIRSQRTKERIKKYNFGKKHCIKDLKSDDKITLYYCEFCGCCQGILQFKGHADGSCIKNQKPYKQFCGKCGLGFSPRSIQTHQMLHEKRQFSLKDIKVVNLTTDKQIDPPMPEFFKCENCEKHFLSRKIMNEHNCKTEKHVTCKICSKKLSLQAFKIHKMFHSFDKLMPELMKKYNSIKNMWNVIYMCSACDLVTMTYDSAVTHSQGHLNYVISDLNKYCAVCDLNIAEKEFSNHEILHTNNQDIERGSFRILKYNHEDLFKKEWMSFFRPLIKQHRHQILSKSIYRFTRSVKIQVEVSGAPTDDIKYFCMNCKRFVDGPNIAQHIKIKCSRSNKYICEICHEIFKSLKNFVTHEGSHEKVPKRHTIATFNNECDQEFNNHLHLIESKAQNFIKEPIEVPKSKLRELLSTAGAQKSFKIYKCIKCAMCMTLKNSARRHSCVGKSVKKTYCEICEQFYCCRMYPLHMKAHRKQPAVNKNTLSIVYFNCAAEKKFDIAKPKKIQTAKLNKNEIVKPLKVLLPELVAKIYKCECGLHFTSMRTIQNHLDICSPDLEVSKETCSKCKLVFSTDVLVTHLINHHSKEMKMLIEKVEKVNIYKCPNCVLFFTSLEYFNSHMDDCDVKNGKECPECRVVFDKKCFAKHKCSSQDTTYLTKIITMKRYVKSVTVYKCEQCDITYLRYNSFKYHTLEVNHINQLPLFTCEYCKLRFTKYSYHKHYKMHNFRNEDYEIKVINPVKGNSVIITGRNDDRDTENDDSNISSRKRKSYTRLDEIKPKKSFTDNNLSDRTIRRLNRTIEQPSTSNSVDYNADDETIVADITPKKHENNKVDTDQQGDENSNSDIFDNSETPKKTIDSVDTSNIVSKKMKARILVHKYSKDLYRCKYCDQHYMKDTSFNYHIKTYNHLDKPENFKCDICELDFSRNTLPRHKYVHHQNMNLKTEDFVILTETAFTRETNIFADIEKTLEGKVNMEIVDLDENGDESATIDNSIENDSVNIIIENEIKEISDICETNSDIAENVSDTIENVSDSDKICYYKCAECNVCFINQQMCSEHVVKHEILDPKTYIQCKICNFQFLIDFLREHVEIHHSSDFKIENLTIHEYKGSQNGSEPNVDIYKAVDKVQSRLVSTTTEIGIV